MKTQLKINGMSCTSCAAGIEKKLNAIEFVDEATVNFATEILTLRFNEKMIELSEIIAHIQELGFKAEPVDNPTQIIKKSVKIKGMSCVNCAKAIEDKLSEQNGIDSAVVNFPAEKLLISYQPHKINFEKISSIVKSLGYDFITESLLDEGKDADQEKMNAAWKRTLKSAFLSGIVMLLMMIHMFVYEFPFYLPLISVFAFINIFIIGNKVHRSSIGSVRNLRANMDVLVSLGSVPPFLIGLTAIFFDIQSFIEMATMIMTFHLIGKYLEVRAKGRASQAIKRLLQLGAKTARIIRNGEETEIPASELRLDDVMVIRPGEKIPTDGVIIEGSTYIDESMATGESIPVQRKAGERVIGATINSQGYIKVKVTKIGKDTFLAQVIKLVEECQGSKVPIQEFADTITGYFVPGILFLTALTFTSFLLFPDFHEAIMEWGASFLFWVNPDLPPLTLAFITSTAVLVIACPCALGLGTPTALMVGSGIGAENGILIRNGEAIQTLKSTRMIAFDKTGTITLGKPEVTDLMVFNNAEKDELLFYAASLEKGSEHILAKAVIEKSKHLKLSEVSDFEAVSGEGITGMVDNKKVILGNKKIMDRFNIDYSTVESYWDKLASEAKTTVLVAVENSIIGLLAIADPIKEEAKVIVSKLKNMGIDTALITGDNKQTAAAIAQKAGITKVLAEVLPDGKVEEIKRLQQQYNNVAMVGDGINDAPALKQANIGIAIGTGTDIAIEAADVTIVSGNLTQIVSAIILSQGTFRKIKENYFWAWFYNAIAIPVAMLGLLHPLIGAAAMSLSSLNVVFNSLRLRKINLT